MVLRGIQIKIKFHIKKFHKKIDKSNNRTINNELDIIKSNANSIKAVAMIRSYRQRGHLIAKLDPLGIIKIRLFRGTSSQSLMDLKKRIINEENFFRWSH